MKKVFLIFLILNCLFAYTPTGVFANNETSYYAKIQSTGASFCSSPSENSALFEIPYSYFVKVESIVDDYYKVTYKDLSGFVKKDKAKLMSGTPTSPYAEATFQIYSSFSLYESPSKNSVAKITLAEQTSLAYYGIKTGQQLSSKSNEWIFSSTSQNGQIFYGYVYTGIVDIMPNINQNTETFETISEDIFNNSSSSELSSMSTGTKIMLIISISIPSILILYFLIKPNRILQSTKTRKAVKKENKKIRHGDYFEFDESQL